MAFVAFVCSVVVCGAVLSLIPVDTMSSQEDYHYVPAAGDVFGA